MREDHEEALRKMFPDGYVIAYIQKNNDPAYHWFNPKNDEFIVELLNVYDYMYFEGEEFEGEVN